MSLTIKQKVTLIEINKKSLKCPQFSYMKPELRFDLFCIHSVHFVER